MVKKVLLILCFAGFMVALYLATWPVPIDPVAWLAPPNPGYNGPFAQNERLKGMQPLSIGNHHGPEDIALDHAGRIYVATHEGHIVRLRADGTHPEVWADTGGRPLGLDFDRKGHLIVADAFRGLLSISPTGAIQELATVANETPIKFADDVDVAADGKIYFSDASTKFGALERGGVPQASRLDLMEHGGHGRLLVYNPADRTTRTLLTGLNFANGVAVAHDQTFVLVNETGAYRVMRYWLAGARQGQAEPFIEALPAFPDNLSTGSNGRFWVALIAPRNKLLDKLADKPFARKMVHRLPAFLRPKATHFGHIIALDRQGHVIMDLQDPFGSYPMNTSVTETSDFLYVGSLVAPEMRRLSKAGLKMAALK
ncbi:MAG: SMP-30/gluconolactonase/LRE family protein [Desulfobacterales bacterium]|nr:SMP-30/gluconolactonase/LRE family protein [Desulfobacterales bacterium]